MARRWVVIVERGAPGQSFAAESFAEALELAAFDGHEWYDVHVAEAPDAGWARRAWEGPAGRLVARSQHAAGAPAWVGAWADELVGCSELEWSRWLDRRWMLERVSVSPGRHGFPFRVEGINYGTVNTEGRRFVWSVPDLGGRYGWDLLPSGSRELVLDAARRGAAVEVTRGEA